MPFACIHIPHFILQAALRAEPELCAQPAGILDGNPPLLTIVAVNEKAARLGLRLEMTKLQAEQIPGLQIRRRSAAQETAAHAALVDLALAFSPRIEDTAADTIALDLAGLAALFGSLENLAHRMAARAAEFGFSANVGVASNPEAAQLAARGFSGVTLLAPEEEAQRLGGLPVSALHLSAEMRETLDRWGVRTCAALAALPVAQLSERLGQEGVRMQELARGANVRALIPAQGATQFEEALELDTPVSELEPLAFLLGRLLDQLCARLSARALATNEIRLKMKLEPGEEEIFPVADESVLQRNSARKKSGRKNSAAAQTAPSIYESTLRLPLPMRDSKVLLRLWRLHLEADPPVSPIVKIEMTAEPARTRFAQSGLFQPLSPDPEKLEITMARARHLVGEANIGAPEPVNTHRPLAFAMKRFDPAAAADDFAGQPAAQAALAPVIALRAFRPALPARVEVRADVPVRVLFNGVCGEVIAASGPWRNSGDWWTEDPWNQDEWDLEIEFPLARAKESKLFAVSKESAASRGVYRVIYERAADRWSIGGVYD
ncbi:MAG TPA: DNA polymerase Y family protein [Candidatus Acidoferrales bacterium]|nr:DNA polymerase Y family protein [Candidatus Acidoferrales bacterium]